MAAHSTDQLGNPQTHEESRSMAIAPGSIEEISKKAGNAQLLGILSIVFAICCGCVGLILGVIAMNQANAVLATIQSTGVGREFEGKASTAKTLGIVGIAIAVLNMVAGVAIQVMNRQ
jgi:type III secretory pathway lipoprotein EscJ